MAEVSVEINMFNLAQSIVEIETYSKRVFIGHMLDLQSRLTTGRSILKKINKNTQPLPENDV